MNLLRSAVYLFAAVALVRVLVYLAAAAAVLGVVARYRANAADQERRAMQRHVSHLSIPPL